MLFRSLPTFCQTTELHFFLSKRKQRRFSQNALIAFRTFKAHFAKSFQFVVARVQDCCKHNKRLEQKLFKLSTLVQMVSKKKKNATQLCPILLTLIQSKMFSFLFSSMQLHGLNDHIFELLLKHIFCRKLSYRFYLTMLHLS